MRFTTPHGSVRYRLPWSWSSFDYRRLCELLYAQSDVRFATAKVEGRLGRGCPAHGEPIAVSTDRGVIRAALVVDALGWRRVLGARGYQPPAAPLSRGLEVHPPVPPVAPRPAHEPAPTVDLDVWLERSLVARGYGWCVPAGDEARVGVGSYAPAQHVRESTVELTERLQLEPVRYQGNWFPHRLRAGTEDGVFFAGDSAGHCFALSGEGIRTAFYFGIACGRELRAVIEQGRSREDALRRYRRFSAAHRRAFAVALGLQRLIPALPPRLLTFGLRAIDRQWVLDRAFGWYLDQAHPAFAQSRLPSQAATGPSISIGSYPTP